MKKDPPACRNIAFNLDDSVPLQLILGTSGASSAEGSSLIGRSEVLTLSWKRTASLVTESGERCATSSSRCASLLWTDRLTAPLATRNAQKQLEAATADAAPRRTRRPSASLSKARPHVELASQPPRPRRITCIHPSTRGVREETRELGRPFQSIHVAPPECR